MQPAWKALAYKALAWKWELSKSLSDQRVPVGLQESLPYPFVFRVLGFLLPPLCRKGLLPSCQDQATGPPVRQSSAGPHPHSWLALSCPQEPRTTTRHWDHLPSLFIYSSLWLGDSNSTERRKLRPKVVKERAQGHPAGHLGAGRWKVLSQSPRADPLSPSTLLSPLPGPRHPLGRPLLGGEASRLRGVSRLCSSAQEGKCHKPTASFFLSPWQQRRWPR